MTVVEDRPVHWIDREAMDREVDLVARTGAGTFGPPSSARIRSAVLRTMVRLSALAVGIVVFGVFAVTPDGTGLIQGFDSALSRALHVGGFRPTSLTAQFGAPPVVLLASFAVGIVFWCRQRTVLVNIRPILLTAGSGAVALVAGSLVRRPGPGRLGDLSAATATSFPSISAAMLAGLACAAIGVVGKRHRRRSEAAMLAVALLPSIVRLASASTWPLDEVMGVMTGWAVVRSVGLRHVPIGTILRRRSLRPIAITGLVVVAVIGGIASASFAAMLAIPGNAAFDQRAVEWLRGNGLGPLVDRGESWWLWRHLPSPTDTISRLPAPPIDVGLAGMATGDALRAHGPAAIPLAILPGLAGEGMWTVADVDQAGRAEIATADFRPDPGHPSVVVAVAWINSATTRISLVAGTRQPGHGAGPSDGRVPSAALSTLLAAFNSGYKMQDTPGGTLIEGRTTRSMVNGLATLAVRPDGTATVGEWGSGLSISDGYVGLRQNLHLMVSAGAAVPGVRTNAGGRWGTVRNTLPTWRSGLGVTAAGDLVYVAGDHLTLGVLADTLVRVGAVTAMELDIHKGMVTFNLFTHHPGLAGHKLLPAMPSSADRYLATDWRDFVVVTARASM